MYGLVAELVDATDLKSVDRKVVRVRVPPCPLDFMDRFLEDNLWDLRLKV